MFNIPSKENKMPLAISFDFRGIMSRGFIHCSKLYKSIQESGLYFYTPDHVLVSQTLQMYSLLYSQEFSWFDIKSTTNVIPRRVLARTNHENIVPGKLPDTCQERIKKRERVTSIRYSTGKIQNR